jgi:hypothetical protein
MTRRQIQRFFGVLDRELGRPARIIVTGAAAGALWGSGRPSLDIDFEIRLVKGTGRGWDAIEAAIRRTEQLTGIAAHYAEDIDRWGAISLLDYGARTVPFARIGRLHVRLMDPAYWAIGKLTRYLEPDRADVQAVLRLRRPSPARTIGVWAKALRDSPRSAACTQFREHVEHFLRSSAAAVWGPSVDAERLVARFLAQARRIR